jgi:hypothetical protein
MNLATGQPTLSIAATLLLMARIPVQKKQLLQANFGKSHDCLIFETEKTQRL